ncbi:MAG: hypothetical protein L6R35_006792, partial [Caloplaca aegaea]
LEGSESVTVKVGEGEAAVAWNLPGALLRHASPFFAAALSGPWPESESKTIEMKEDKPAAFRFFVRWMYTWVCSAEEKHPNQVVNNVLTSICIQAWVLGDKLLCPHFQDFALISLHARLTKSDEDLPSVICCAYRDTLPQSKLRDFGASILLDRIVNKKSDFHVGHFWIKLVHEVKDLSTDIVRIQMTRPKPFVLQLNWSELLMASSYTNYEFRNIK